MSVNIMDMIKGAVSDQVMGQLGGLIGQSDQKRTKSIFETVAGSVLGGIMQKASSPQGAKDVYRAVEDHDDSVLDKLGDILGGGSADEGFLKQGGGILDMVFGNSQSGMMDAIAKHLGLDGGIIGKLLKMIAPIVMGVLGRHVRSKALDAVGLGNLLGSQGSVLSNVLPSSLSNSLGFGNMLSGAADSVRDAGAAVSGAARDAGNRAYDAAGDAASSGGSLLKVLLPLILLAALAWFGYKWFMGQNNAAPGDGTTVADTDLSDIDFGDFDMGGLKDKFAGITDGFKNVTADNADDLATKIKDLTGSVDSMGFDALTGPAKKAAGGVVGAFIDQINAAVDKISDDGIMGLIKPLVKTLVAKLENFR